MKSLPDRVVRMKNELVVAVVVVVVGGVVVVAAGAGHFRLMRLVGLAVGGGLGPQRGPAQLYPAGRLIEVSPQ